MKIKVSEADGAVLDWLVARAEGKELYYFADDPFKKDPWLMVNNIADQPLHSFTPSTDWGQGGPIIEREGIAIGEGEEAWWAFSSWRSEEGSRGPTPLIAATRCYVVSKLGDEVEIPEELK